MSFISPEDFLARANERLLPIDAALEARPRGDHDLPGFETRMQRFSEAPVAKPRIAAVLIGLLERENDYGVQLTLRPDTMAQHAGQIAFPGGRQDPEDATLLAAALREADEEIGLKAPQVQIIGRSDGYLTGTGFLIAPFVGLIEPGFKPDPHPEEVADVFETPLSFLMTPENHERHSAVWKGRKREYFAMPHNGRYIWGATAGMIRALYERLYAEPRD